ncbi:MAG: hypothetical protein KJZ52_08405, partial [Anaerolineales bacterium]|nr:hypothetical protein [Anaerolineales bacterium]
RLAANAKELIPINAPAAIFRLIVSSFPESIKRIRAIFGLYLNQRSFRRLSAFILIEERSSLG